MTSYWIAAALVLALGAATTGDGTIVDDLVKAGKLDEAIAAGRAAVDARPKNPDARVALAHALAAKGRDIRWTVETAGSAEDLIGGKVILPGLGPDHPAHAVVNYDPALLANALRQIREAIRLAPDRAEIRLTECYVLADSGNVDGALAAVQQVLAVLPRTTSLGSDLAGYGNELAKRGDPQGGARLLEPVVKAFPKDATLSADYGFALAQAGRRTEASEELARSEKLAPLDTRVLRRNATAYTFLREFRSARKAWLAAAGVARDDVDRLGAASAAIVTDVALAKTELSALATPAASSDAKVVETAGDLLRAASAPAAAKDNVAIAKKLVDGGQDLLAVPVLHRLLRADAGHKDAVTVLSGIQRRFGFKTAADEIWKNASAPSRKSKPATQPKPDQAGGAKRP